MIGPYGLSLCKNRKLKLDVYGKRQTLNFLPSFHQRENHVFTFTVKKTFFPYFSTGLG